MRDKPKHNMIDVQRELGKSSKPAHQGTTALSFMMENGTVADTDLTKQEEFVKTRINQLHDSFDKLDNWALTSGVSLTIYFKSLMNGCCDGKMEPRCCVSKSKDWTEHSQKMTRMPST